MSSKTLGFVVVDIDSTLADTRQRHGKSPHSDPEAKWNLFSFFDYETRTRVRRSCRV